MVPLSTSYAIAETAGVERSLSRKLREAPFFYGMFTVQLVIGALIALLPGNAVELVINAQALNGFITPDPADLHPDPGQPALGAR